MQTYQSLKKELLKNKQVRRAYDELGPEFELIEQIIERRMKKGMSQQVLARKLKTKQSAISRLESGRYNPSFKFLARVAKALDTNLKISI